MKYYVKVVDLISNRTVIDTFDNIAIWIKNMNYKYDGNFKFKFEELTEDEKIKIYNKNNLN